MCLAVLFTAYGLTEVYLRWSVSPPARPEEFLFPKLPLSKERIVITRALPGLGPRSVLRTTNALGLRADELDLYAKDPVLRIVVLGGSSAECLLLGDDGGWPRILQDLLAKALKRKVWVANIGMSGQATLDYITHVKLLLPQIHPDLVIAMAGGNDLHAVIEGRYFPVNLADPATLMNYARPLYAESSEAVRRLNRLEWSYTVFFLRRLWEETTVDFTPLYTVMKGRRYKSAKLEEIPDFEDAVDIYQDNLKTLIAAVRALGSVPVLLTQPYLWKKEMPDEERRALWAGYSCMDCRSPHYYSERAMIAGMNRFNAVLLATCKANAIECLDVEPKIEKSLTNFYDDAHLKEAGSRRVAELLASFLLSGVLPQIR